MSTPERTGGGEAFALLLDYERRSLAHEAGLPERLDAPGLWRGVGYRIGARRLASNFDEVVEILPLPQITPVPGAQGWMLGVANVRGNLLPIVDLKQFLEGERTVLHESQRMLVVRSAGRCAGAGPLRAFRRSRVPPRRPRVGDLQPRTADPHAGVQTSRGLTAPHRYTPGDVP